MTSVRPRPTAPWDVAGPPAEASWVAAGQPGDAPGASTTEEATGPRPHVGPAVSGPGDWPGTEPLEAQLTVLGDLTDVPDGVLGIPFLPVLAQRGPGADPVGRTAALLDQMPVELGPHGWRLADHGGIDAERADAVRREDLDALAISASSYDGELAVPVVGPWTLSAALYLARGDRVLSDHGAVRELTQSLASGLRAHLADVRRRAPWACLTVQVDESLVGQVAAGVLPTFSGYSRLRAVPGPRLVEGLEPVLREARAAGARSVVHVGDAWVGIAPVALAGADALGLDLGPWDEHGWSLVARAVERGMGLWAGLPPARVSQCAGVDVGSLVQAVAEPWHRIGLPASSLDRVVLTKARGPLRAAPQRATRGGDVDGARGDLRSLVRAALRLAERAAG